MNRSNGETFFLFVFLSRRSPSQPQTCYLPGWAGPPPPPHPPTPSAAPAGTGHCTQVDLTRNQLTVWSREQTGSPQRFRLPLTTCLCVNSLEPYQQLSCQPGVFLCCRAIAQMVVEILPETNKQTKTKSIPFWGVPSECQFPGNIFPGPNNSIPL